MSDCPQKEKPDFTARMHDVPHKPGVYLMRDRFKKVIYVGKARDLRKRVSQYFHPSRKMTADAKTRSLINSIWDFDIHTVKSEPEALLLESRLIKEYRPKYNVSLRDDKRFLMLKVNLKDPFPRFQLTRMRMDDGARYFGPFVNSVALRATLHWMVKQFGLRTCRPRIPGETDYKHCHDHIIRNCCAPCIGKVNSEEYHLRVTQGCDFLDGKSRELLDEVKTQMHTAADRMQFERAAELRDMLDSLKTILKPMRRFTRHSLPGAIDPAADLKLLGEALGMATGPRIMECFDISNISNTHIVASMVCFRDGVPDKSNYRRYRITTVKGQDDFASMAEVIRRRYSRILLETRKIDPDKADESQLPVSEAIDRTIQTSSGKGFPYVRLPDLVIVDGGKGQLSSACKELQELGLQDLPIIGLAKEFEEIHRPGRPQPLVLPDDSGALKLLQRIRDEAHRFANGYHQLLMKRRMAESILDECPGVSENRKQLLLKTFGSVKRLRKADEPEIAAVAGIGPKLAAEITKFLENRA